MADDASLSPSSVSRIIPMVHDRMTETVLSGLTEAQASFPACQAAAYGDSTIAKRWPTSHRSR